MTVRTDALKRAIFFFALSTSLLLCGCSGDNSPAPTSLPKSSVRILNAALELGNIEFQIGASNLTLAPNSISSFFSVDVGVVIVSAKLPTNPTPIQVSLQLAANEELTVALSVTKTGVAAITALARVPTSNSSGTTIAFSNLTPYHPSVDVYVLPPGGQVANSIPVMPGVSFLVTSAFAPIAFSTYSIALTPAGKQTVLFQSAPITTSGAGTTLLFGMQASPYVLTPQPLLLTGQIQQLLQDVRPAVHILRTSWALDPPPNGILTVDGDFVAKLPPSASNMVYHATAGSRMLATVNDAGSIRNNRDFSVATGSTYIQRYGISGYTPSSGMPLSEYKIPEVTTDYPVPTGKARIRLRVSNCCRSTDLYVGGALLQANVREGEWLLDREPGNFSVDVLMPGNGASEGRAQVATMAGHYYLVEVFDLGESRFQFRYDSGAPVARQIIVSRDD